MNYRQKLAEMNFSPNGSVASLIEAAIRLGEAMELERIHEILTAPLAAENLALAWELARDRNCSREAAAEVLRISFLNSAPLPVGEAGEPLAH